MAEIWTLPFLRDALLASVLVAVVGALFGLYLMMKRVVFVGVALGQISGAGMALAVLLGWGHPSWWALAASLAGVALLAVDDSRRPVPREGIVGISYAVASAMAILFLAKSAQGESDILNMMFGNVLAIDPTQLFGFGCLVACLVVAHAVFAKELILTTFDPETARVLGVRVWLWDLGYYVGLGVVIAEATRLVGALLIFAYLVLPAFVALRLARRMTGAFVVACGIAVSSAVIGMWVSFHWDLPTGAAQVAVLGTWLLLIPVQRVIVMATGR